MKLGLSLSLERAAPAGLGKAKYNRWEKGTLCPMKRKTIQKDFQFSLATETRVLEKATNSKVFLKQPNNPKDKGAVKCHLQRRI